MPRGNFIESYDAAITGARAKEIHGDSGFYNMGYWGQDLPALPENMERASLALVGQHLKFETPDTIRKVASVLDVACGLGATTSQFVKAYPNADVTGINISQLQVDLSAARCPAARFHCMDAVELDFPAESFDRIHCVEAAFYFDTRLRFLEEARRVLRPNGMLVMTDVLFRSQIGLQMPKSNLGEDVAGYRAKARQAGFRALSIEDITEATVLPFATMLARKRQEALNRTPIEGIDAYLLIALEAD